mmetsp:Transcript_17154/g.53328  ORF Transcript_17154/g.53328 Transcript_17154/m.53328 type:complete len:200 (-) Transcript_17154:530-1129(-)
MLTHAARPALIAASNTGVCHCWLEAMFHARPKPARIMSVRTACIAPLPSELLTPNRRKRPTSSSVVLLPRARSTNVTALRTCWKTPVPAAVVKKSTSMHSALAALNALRCHSTAECSQSAGTTGTDSDPTLACCVSTPAARRPTSAGTKRINELIVIWPNVTPHPRSSTIASTNTNPPSMSAMFALEAESAYEVPPVRM